MLGSRCLLVWYFGQNSIDAKKIILLNLRYSREHKCYCIERVLPRFLSDYFLIADIPTEIRRGCNVVASEQTLVLERPFTSGGATIYLISCCICFFDESVVGYSSGLSRRPRFAWQFFMGEQAHCCLPSRQLPVAIPVSAGLLVHNFSSLTADHDWSLSLWRCLGAGCPDWTSSSHDALQCMMKYTTNCLIYKEVCRQFFWFQTNCCFCRRREYDWKIWPAISRGNRMTRDLCVTNLVGGNPIRCLNILFFRLSSHVFLPFQGEVEPLRPFLQWPGYSSGAVLKQNVGEQLQSEIVCSDY